MSVVLHVILVLVATALGLFAGWVTAAWLLRWAGATGWLVTVPSLAAALACAWALRWWLTQCVPAKCPSCGGPAYSEPRRFGSRDRIRYRCLVCKDVYPRALSEGR